ncbi:DUF3801 domain-containing protein [Streptococcus ovuberis]|uniref:DUF3801 domain-containing protein n=1 Tax=Streptococcus ovuberis TaxID=1936207 RepID=A0A7X6MWI6_9STRE|nr:DUF3801 domain-containing protein [Streptococcus ovuberis]NKZ19690.1 DUF3801 domain-containing protein [Streptococcus ovuberis]
MDQEKTVRQLKENARATGEFILKAIYFFTTRRFDGFQQTLMDRTKHLRGEQDWGSFMGTPEAKELKTFLNHEVNIDALKKHLKTYGVAFAMRETEAGKIQLLFQQKDVAILTQVFDDLIKQLTDKSAGKQLNARLLRPNNAQSLEDKLAYQTQRVQDRIALKQALDSAKKVSRRAEVSEVSKS